MPKAAKKTSKQKTFVNKSVSLHPAHIEMIERLVLAGELNPNFSRYVQELVEKDLKARKAKAEVKEE